MEKMKKERKKCKKIFFRRKRHVHGREVQMSKAKRHRKRKRKRRERKCSKKSRRQGRFGLGGFAFSGSWATPLIGLGGLGLFPGLGLGLGTGLGLGLGTGVRIYICSTSFSSWTSIQVCQAGPLGQPVGVRHLEKRLSMPKQNSTNFSNRNLKGRFLLEIQEIVLGVKLVKEPMQLQETVLV